MKKLSTSLLPLFVLLATCAQGLYAQKFIDQNTKPIIDNVIELYAQGGGANSSTNSSVAIPQGVDNPFDGGVTDGGNATPPPTTGNTDPVPNITSVNNGGELDEPLIMPVELELDEFTQDPSIEGDLNDFVVIYPNPANQALHIDLPYSELVEINLYTIVGQQVFMDNYYEVQRVALDVQNYSNGVYVLEVVSQGERVVRKITIRH